MVRFVEAQPLSRPYLDFNADGLYIEENQMQHCVNSVIESHKAPSLKQFRICFPVDKSAKSTVTKWLEFVLSRPVESLELDFSFVDDPDKVVLEELLRETSIIFGASQTLPFCQSLKSLYLEYLIVGGQDVELFLCNCPLLEELTIINAALMSDINVCGTKLMLKRLAVLGCSGEKSLSIFALNLILFRFNDRDRMGRLVFEYDPKLIEADLKTLRLEFFLQHSAHFSQLQILKLTLCYPKVHYTDVFSHMPNLKKLFLCLAININQGLLPITDLIWAYPRLEEFTFKFDTGSDPRVLTEDITDVKRSPHQHLKVLELQMYSQETDHLMELVSYLSDHCVALRKIIIRRGDVDRHEEFPADWEHLKQQLQGKIRSEIQLGLHVLLV